MELFLTLFITSNRLQSLNDKNKKQELLDDYFLYISYTMEGRNFILRENIFHYYKWTRIISV